MHKQLIDIADLKKYLEKYHRRLFEPQNIDSNTVAVYTGAAPWLKNYEKLSKFAFYKVLNLQFICLQTVLFDPIIGLYSKW